MYENIKGLINFFVQPFLDLITDLGLENQVIKIGFGSIEWINFELYDLVNLVMSGLVVYMFIRLVYKLFKLVVKIVSGGVL